MSGKREREREKISKFEKFVVGPFAVGNEINISSFDKKKVSKKSKRRKRRNVVFSNDSFIPSLSTSRVFFCFATPLLYISYLPSSSSNPSSPYIIPFFRPSFVRVSYVDVLFPPAPFHYLRSRLQRYFLATFLLPCEFARIFPSTLFSPLPIEQFHRAELIISLNAKENPRLSI